MEAIGIKSFTQFDIDRFAEASGDYNPVHVDPVIARRLITGGTVVHGMYSLLWMMERHFESGGRTYERLNAYFPRPVKAGDPLELQRQPDEAGGGVRLELLRQGETVATVVLSGSEVAPLDMSPQTRRPDRRAPDERTFAGLKGLAGQTPIIWNDEDVLAGFPLTANRLGGMRVATIMALSRLVGMQAPGLHSIFTGLVIAFDETVGPIVEWRVSRASVAIAPIRVALSGGGLSGHADAIVRPAPVEQPHMAALQTAVEDGEFFGQRALVVGGSRGLGELVAKLVVAGGGEATISYLAGEADARRVVSEIAAWGGKCTAMRLDIAEVQSLPKSLSGLEQPPTHVYYFPTPRISKRQAPDFDTKVFTQFTDIYLKAFDRLIAALAEGNAGPIRVFYPSTSFIDEVPAGFAEYAAAKAAGEALSAYLSKNVAPIDIQVRRLPRLGTDQTASLIPQAVGSALEVMLDIVRDMQRVTQPPSSAS